MKNKLRLFLEKNGSFIQFSYYVTCCILIIVLIASKLSLWWLLFLIPAAFQLIIFPLYLASYILFVHFRNKIAYKKEIKRIRKEFEKQILKSIEREVYINELKKKYG